MVLFVRSIIPRLLAALATSPSRGDVAWTAGIGAVHATLSFGFARWSRFITPRYAKLGPWGLIGVVVKTLITPSIIEEAIFRGALLPHPAVDEAMTWTASLGMTAFASNLLFVIYHLSPWHRPKKVFSDRRFLTLAGILGMACTAVYLPNGCLWMSIAVHHITVVTWLLFLGGYDQLGKP